MTAPDLTSGGTVGDPLDLARRVRADRKAMMRPETPASTTTVTHAVAGVVLVVVM